VPYLCLHVIRASVVEWDSAKMSSPVEQVDTEITHVIADAYNQICKHLRDTGQPEIVREVISERIINAAKSGERDPVRLRDIVLESFGLKRDAT
jgi:hypothetical protein